MNAYTNTDNINRGAILDAFDTFFKFGRPAVDGTADDYYLNTVDHFEYTNACVGVTYAWNCTRFEYGTREDDKPFDCNITFKSDGSVDIVPC